jgi:hypothetical protein
MRLKSNADLECDNNTNNFEAYLRHDTGAKIFYLIPDNI